MNKATLIARVAEKTGLSHEQAKETFEALLDIVTETLKRGEKVQIVGFGTFDVREREEHKGLNPATREEITVAAARTPFFRPAKTYKDEF